MRIHPTPLYDVRIIEPEPFADERGWFGRLFCQKELRQLLDSRSIVQINHSLTVCKGAIRGLHFQSPPKAEKKFVRCLRGSVFDVAVDLRYGSPTFLKWHGERLSEENMKTMYVPEGFAHGFQTLDENTELLYLHTEFYSPEHEGAVRYDEPMIDISWPLEITDISDRDRSHALLTGNFKGIVLQ
ncbi:MAG: dTDP-4-dehydrorhamnose 3,5-epimerase [Deltaproteobacteria bacterium]|nr:dTDP-4-dehydrorhamnose 3,5-epimerase [Deltaproteobacteria bacterium]MBW2119436.1 dTDP-4-dehydrorhamnose 3,5-epimerase [Deltaproteobacteria bacterium]MBW2342547.1 dTDP-4-dehydrorhamnose 3,5-epimerase [Deltaproteobacteria bacterium]